MRRTDVASMKDESHYLWLLCLLLLLAGPPCSWINDPEQRSTPHYLPPLVRPSIYLHTHIYTARMYTCCITRTASFIFRRCATAERVGSVTFWLLCMRAICRRRCMQCRYTRRQNSTCPRNNAARAPEMIKLMNEKYYFNARKGWKKGCVWCMVACVFYCARV